MNKERRHKVPLLVLFDKPESRGKMLRSLCAFGLIYRVADVGSRSDTVNYAAG